MKRFLILSLALGLSLIPALSQTKIMCLGDSITKGAVDPGPSLSGYRARLFDNLNQAGLKYQFIGCTVNNSNRAMISAGQAYHNGYGSFRMDEIRKNLDGEQRVGRGDDNMDGYWLTGGNGTHRDAVNPDIVLLLAGTNDLGSGATEPELEKRMLDILNWFQTNRPLAQIYVGTVPPRGPSKPDFNAYNLRTVTFNTWLASMLPKMGSNFHLVDIHRLFTDASGNVKDEHSPDGIFLKDGIHPSHEGYVATGDAWFSAIKSILSPSPIPGPASTAIPAPEPALAH